MESPKSTRATRGDIQLWRDEVQLLEDNSEANTNIRVKDRRANIKLEQADKENIISSLNYSESREILSNIEGVLVGVLAIEQFGNVDAEVIQDKVRSDIQTIDDKSLDTNGTVNQDTVNVKPSLELQHQNAIVIKDTNGDESQHAMLPHQAGAIEPSHMACTSGTE